MSRRSFLAGMTAAASAAAGAGGLVLGQGTAWAAGGGGRLPVPDLLRPTRRNGVSVFSLEAGFGTHELLPGVPSPTAGFNGPYLGPTLRFRNGEQVGIEVLNHLDEDLAVHWHGAHVPAEWDGGVHAAFGPGQIWRPHFTVKQQAATLWYHPHTMGATARQIAWGLAGMLIIDDDTRACRALPHDYGIDDIPVILHSAAVDPEGGIRYDARGYRDRDVVFPLMVNGVAVNRDPLAFTATRGRVRLRMLNASLSETILIRRVDLAPLTQVATESAFLNGPLPVPQLRLPAGCRAEVVVDVARRTDLELLVQTSVGRNRDARFTFLSLRPGAARAKAKLPALPSRLNTIHRYDVSGVRPRVIALTEEGGMLGINGVSGTTMKAMDDHEIVVRLGDLEVWDVVNKSRRMHSFHVHDVPFQLVSIGGRAPHGADLGWRDTVPIPPRTTVRIAMRFTDFASEKYTYMLHCHMAEHEDQGMMTSLKVMPR